MNNLFALILFVASSATLTLQNHGNDQVWQNYKLAFDKTYASPEEETLRKEIWQEKVKEIYEHNLRHNVGLESYEQGVNQFTDLTWEEIEAGYLLNMDSLDDISADAISEPWSVDGSAAPESVDWRKDGWVTPVLSQGTCGSCWAFAAAGALEGQMMNKTGKLEELSVQQMVDCSKEDTGCHGGLPHRAMAYTAKAGIDSSAYEYTAEEGQCKQKSYEIVYQNAGAELYTKGGEKFMKELVFTRGPLAITIEATGRLSGYSRGIFKTDSCKMGKPNHAVLAVGYGETDDGQKYWIIKNCWGVKFGEKGYVRMARDNNEMCCLGQYMSAAVN